MEELQDLFKKQTGSYAKSIARLSAEGSNRLYFRLKNDEISLIGVVGTSKEENHAFIEIAKDFYKKGLAVPRLFCASDDEMCYLQEDLGNLSLFDFILKGRETGVFSDEEKNMLRKTIQFLPEIQIRGAQNLDFSICYPQATFDKRTVFWDLNYFKYAFLKLTGIDFQENKLEDDFVRFSEILLHSSDVNAFLYRDFQSRNVMIKDNEPHFIDFQGGRKGPLQYDVASFLWQAKANFPSGLREELLEAYLNSLSRLISVDKAEFRKELNHFVLFRTLQVLGAYGFRGLFEKKTYFRQSIPFAIENLRLILAKIDKSDYPYLVEILSQLTELKQFQFPGTRNTLLVKVYSFSYKKGIPEDDSGNGGGFVFDCRAIHNPGRYAEYKPLTGLDKAVIDFLEKNSEITNFLNNVYPLVGASVAQYQKRGFTDLMVSFGCTGGQHRSVYCAQHLAEHIHNKFGVEVRLIHREQNIEQRFV